jgi:hypothetical protein
MILGLLFGIFEPVLVVLGVCSLLISPALFVLFGFWRFDRLAMGFMFILSNLFLLHDVVAIKLSDGRNLVGIRDILWVLVLVVGIAKSQGRLREAARHPLIWPGLVLLCLTPFACLIGMINGGTLGAVLREVYPFTSPAIALVIYANVKDYGTLRGLTVFFLLMGLLVAFGTIAEVVTLGNIRVVSTYTAEFLSVSVRAWPDGWIFMFVTLVYAAVAVATEGNVLFWGSIIAVITTGFLLAQMRGVLLTFVAAVVLLILAAKWRRLPWMKIRRLTLPIFVLVGATLIGLGVLFYVLGPTSFLPAVERYTYAQLTEDTSERQFEVDHVINKWEGHPLTGLGFGVPYYDNEVVEVLGVGDIRTFAHNILAYHLLKFGPIGLVLFIYFFHRVMISFIRSMRNEFDPRISLPHLGLALGLVAVAVEAQAANVFGDARQAPVAGILIGLVAAYERLHGVGPGTVPSRQLRLEANR